MGKYLNGAILIELFVLALIAVTFLAIAHLSDKREHNYIEVKNIYTMGDRALPTP